MKKDILNAVCELAVKAGIYQAEQRRAFSPDKVEKKHSHDYVSYVDRESERRIVSRLKELLPEAGFMTEEKTTAQSGDEGEYVWIVDPLDGTTNFIHDIGPWGVCIALRHRKELVMGVMYEVTRGELFYATQGGGAWMRAADGSVRQLQVSPVSDTDQALVVVGYPYNAEEYRDFCTSFTARFYGHCASVRSLGSAGAELCYVAAGRVDVYAEAFICTWDVSAGALIVLEAGGKVTDYQGEDKLWHDGREVLATNGLLHGAVVSEMQICKKDQQSDQQ